MSNPPDIDAILSDIVTLPSLPGTTARVLEMLNNPDSSMSEAGQLISTDPGVALKTLRLINSAQYGMPQRITSVEHAVVLLGPRVIKNIVLSAAVFEHLTKGTDDFVRHSICCGIAMEMVTQASGKVQLAPDEAFVFGILHDVGSLIIQQYLPKEHEASVALARQKSIPLYEAEREVMGIDHAQMGGRLAQHWRLPPDLVNGIAGHHDLAACTDSAYRPYAALLAVANYICNVYGEKPGAWPIAPAGADAWADSGLTSEDMPSVMDDFFSALPNVDELIAVAVESPAS